MFNTHLFSFYYSQLKRHGHDEQFIITDEHLVHRIATVLRMKSGEQCILFNSRFNMLVSLARVSRKNIEVTVLEVKSNDSPKIALTLFLPLLKKESLHKAVYGATEMGVTAIQLVVTQKSRQSISPNELERLQKISIAASEQAKHFIMTIVHAPISFTDSLMETQGNTVLLADPVGKSIFTVLDSATASNKLILYVGPEGDLTSEEKSKAFENGLIACKLTPTILQSYQAAILLSGICSTYFSN